MGRCRFVPPEVVRLELSDGDWLDVKKRLTAGETRRVFTRLVKTYTAGDKINLDPELVGKTKILEYVIGWSFVDRSGIVVPFSESAIDSLDEDTYREIGEAIEQHEDGQTKAREHDTKNSNGATISG